MSSERRSVLAESLAAIERLQSRVDAAEAARHEPIAIVGAACRYPGGAETPEQYWALLRDGVDAVADVPADRWDADRFYDADPKAPGKMITKRGGFLRQVDQFDPTSFGISPREAQSLDPQQRLLLETALESLENAAIAPDSLVGSSTGVFIGITTSDYGQLVRAGGVERADVYSATGNALNAAAGRIAFTFGFQGPAVAVDTACSSSLVAVHLACRALRNGEADLALAGGVNVVLSPDAMIMFSKWGMLAPDGHCKTFDAAADGFVRAEGCGMIALKRLSSAQANGDPILAVIRGSAVNQDGRSSGLTVPNGPAQQAVLRRALADARLEAKDIDYVEAHGTGTPLGDPIEIEALGAVMGAGHSSEHPLLVGSAKTNLGHTEAASGMAGLLKVAMSLRHEAIPPHLHFTTPNPGIDWNRLPLRVPTTLTPWPRGAAVRRAGVSSFGFSGTNAHVILEEAPAAAPGTAPSASDDSAVALPLSARDEQALHEVAERIAEFIEHTPNATLRDIATTASTGRAHLPHRAAIVAESTADLARDLRTFARGEQVPGLVQGTTRIGERPKIAFVFTGQGAQYPGMGRALYDSEPVFRDALDRANAILTPLLGRSLLDVLYPPDGVPTPLSETGFTQPALFAVEYALAELWKSWGIKPSVVLGHSVGEYVAACVAGVMSLEDGLALIAERGRLMQALPAGGGMAAIFADEARVAARIAPYGERLSIAAINGPEETVISGDAAAVAQIVASYEAEGIKGRSLEVSHAFHSARLDPMLDALERRAAAIRFAAPNVTLISNLTGAAFPAGASPDAAYWRRHAREPVRFASSLEALRAAGVTAVVEIGPHPTLLALAMRAMPSAPWVSTASLRRGRDDRHEMLGALGTLYTRGASIAWAAVVRGAGRRLSLPTYPFQRQRYWVESVPTRPVLASFEGHPLLGPRRELASAPGTYVWESEISLDLHPWLRDHRVQGAAIVPATAYIEMAIAGARDVLGPGVVVADEIKNLKPLILAEGERRVLQATLVVSSERSAGFSVHSRDPQSPFIAHMTATVTMEPATDTPASHGRDAIDAARARCTTHVDGKSFYAALERKGNQWGPAFQGTQELWLGEGEAIGRVRVPLGVLAEVGQFRFHPAVSDSCGHALVATVPIASGDGATGGAFVGGGVGQIRFHQSPATTTLWAHARLRPSANANDRVVIGDVWVYDESGTLVSETIDARLWYLDESASDAASRAPDDWFYETRWQEAAPGAPSERATPTGTWVVFADALGIGARIAGRRGQAARTVIVTPGDRFSIGGDRATVRPGNPDDYKSLIESIATPAAVVHLWSAGAPNDDVPRHDAESVVHALHGILGSGARARPRIWLVTADSQSAADVDRVDHPFAATLWGIGRTLSAEHAELWGGLVDVSAKESPDAVAAQLIREIESADAEDKIALRGGKRFVARLTRMRPSELADVEIAADGTYLITGGLGGIGLAMAKWLAERGAKQLLLVGRTALPARDTWSDTAPDSAVGRRIAEIRAIEALGARVDTAAVNIGEAGALERHLDARRDRSEPRVRGVIHAAGILPFRALDSEDSESLRATFAAKVDGAWRLHQTFASQELDFFILCSSSSALLRSPLLGAYAAGNSFLDALAHHRRAAGLTALSVNWGTWGEVGMAVEGGRSKGGMLSGMHTISTASGLAALGRLINTNAAHAAVMPIDWPELVRSYPAFAADPFLGALVADLGPATKAPVGAAATAVRNASDDERGSRLAVYLREEAARTLGMRAERLDAGLPLSSLGFDSLMAVQLKNQIENDLGVVVPMIQFLQGPSVNDLTPAVLAAMDGGARAQASRDGDDDSWEAGSL